jgi:hypothetical protein
MFHYLKARLGSRRDGLVLVGKIGYCDTAIGMDWV